MIFIGLGSNQGNPTHNVLRALDILAEKGVEVLRRSGLYLTKPWGITEQDDFINAVAEIAFSGSAEELLDILLGIEQEMGRVRRIKWGPRLIDLDVIEFERQEIETERLLVPHPFYLHRDFVLAPLAELEPNWIPTGQTKTVRQFLKELDQNQMERLPET
jgi:dihydroneopterin aldolase/2-amino-4-hydroxy-6-hydroxymethyldihydropteridine diphosphokinase